MRPTLDSGDWGRLVRCRRTVAGRIGPNRTHFGSQKSVVCAVSVKTRVQIMADGQRSRLRRSYPFFLRGGKRGVRHHHHATMIRRPARGSSFGRGCPCGLCADLSNAGKSGYSRDFVCTRGCRIAYTGKNLLAFAPLQSDPQWFQGSLRRRFRGSGLWCGRGCPCGACSF